MSFKAFITRLNRRDLPLFPCFPKTNFKTVAFAIFALSFAYSTVAFAQTRNIIKDKQDAIKAGSNQESWLDEALGSNVVSTARALNGDIPDDVLNGTATSWIPGGIIGSASNMVAYLYTPQASGVEYLAQVKDGFFGKPAYAQGAGFLGLQPLLPIWRGMRNAIYLLSSLFFIVIGVLIILRVKISPQAVISIQNAIPNLITTLLLVTFSYAIAGLLIDITFLVQGLTLSVLFSSMGNPAHLLNQNLGQAAVSTLSGIFGNRVVAYSLNDLLANNGLLQTIDLTAKLVPSVTMTILCGFFGLIIGGLLSIATANPVPVLVGVGIIPAILLLIFDIILIVKLFKLLFGLIKVYINVLFKIILAPLEIGLGVFPGTKIGFNTWLWELLANLLVFPIVLLYLVITNLIVQSIAGGPFNFQSIWTPGLLGVAGGVTFGSFVGNRLLAALIGFGAFLLIDKLPDMIPQVIFQIKPSPWGTALGQSLKEADPRNTGLYKFGKATLANKAAYNIENGIGFGADVRRYANRILGPGGNTSVAEAVKQQGKS